ncbi:MAG TPA: M48 family metallopeptidase [bacterium]
MASYSIVHRAIKYPRIEFRTGKLSLVLPKGMHAQDVIVRHNHWINEKSKLIKKYLRYSNHVKIIYRPDDVFKKEAENNIKIYSRELKIGVHKTLFKSMRTKWASCSPRHNITLNTLMKYLPKRFIEYIIYHELVHIIERHHNERFWSEIKKKFRDHNKLESSLFSYWFILQKRLNAARILRSGDTDE